VSKATRTGASPLYIASLEGFLPVVTALLNHGASVNQSKAREWVPHLVECAVPHCDVEVCVCYPSCLCGSPMAGHRCTSHAARAVCTSFESC
jgi:hypothetical protein